MKLAHRIGFYSFGFIIGLFLLFFFLGGKKTSCDYSPDARVLKNIRIKERIFYEEALISMKSFTIDTAQISEILRSGNVIFNKSDTNATPCKIYFIEGAINEKNIGLSVENCDSIAKIKSLKIIK